VISEGPWAANGEAEAEADTWYIVIGPLDLEGEHITTFRILEFLTNKPKLNC
jgi:hypothetical protein